jgi:hypothetical protein
MAIRFIQNGWSIKKLVREMVFSSTFRQSSASDRGKASIDSANTYYWRMPRRRLTVEMWRDSVLAASGTLQPVGGKSLELLDPENNRRTVYARVSRLKLNDMLMQFDYPDANVHAEVRSKTVTPLQKLFAMNSPFIIRQSEMLADRIRSGSNGDKDKAIRLSYQLLFNREPSTTELDLGHQFLNWEESSELTTPWSTYTQALLASNEFLYLD